MLVIPAIDLKAGQCVRLRQGRMDDDTVFSDDPVAVAGRWVAAGAKRLHLVDLDGAFAGEPRNAQVVKAIRKAYPDLPCFSHIANLVELNSAASAVARAMQVGVCWAAVVFRFCVFLFFFVFLFLFLFFVFVYQNKTKTNQPTRAKRCI